MAEESVLSIAKEVEIQCKDGGKKKFGDICAEGDVEVIGEWQL